MLFGKTMLGRLTTVFEFTSNLFWSHGLGLLKFCRRQAIGPNVRILLVLVDLATSTDFVSLCKRLVRLDRLSRIVIDEAHLAISSDTYRPTMSNLHLLRTVSDARFLLLSATVPPPMERLLKDRFCMTFETIRTSTVRKNLKYVVQLLDSDEEEDEEQDADEAALMELVETVQAQRSQFQPEDRAIVFCSSKALTVKVAERLGSRVHYYHAALSALAKKVRYNAWVDGNVNVMVATSGFGAGIDYPAIRLVAHFSVSHGLLDYIQETGRAGRDGNLATCLTFASRRSVRHLSNVEDSTDEGRKQRAELAMSFLTPGCLRQKLHSYVDGGADVTNCFGYDAQLCFVCEQALTDANQSPTERKLSIALDMMHSLWITIKRRTLITSP
jgi:superfamily II DNA helicase RecQ